MLPLVTVNVQFGAISFNRINDYSIADDIVVSRGPKQITSFDYGHRDQWCPTPCSAGSKAPQQLVQTIATTLQLQQGSAGTACSA